MEPCRSPFRSTALVPLVFLAGAVFLYSTSLTGEFLNWDDDTYILDNPELEDPIPAAVGRILTTVHHVNYNPLQRLAYLALWRSVGPEPMAFRLLNLLLHVGAAVLAWRIGRRWLGREAPALAAACLLLVHPVNVENVAWISELKTLLAAVFGFGAVLVWISREDGRGTRAAALALFLFSLLSKASLVVLPPLLWVLDRAAGRRRPVSAYAPFFVLSLVLGIVQIHAASTSDAVTPLHGGSLATHLATAIAVVPRYLAGLVWPAGNAPIHVFDPVRSFTDPRLALGVVVLAALGVAGALSCRRERRLVTGIIWFLAVLAPTVLVPIPILYAERYLYLAMPFLALAVADAAWPAGERLRGPAIAAAALVLGVFAFATHGYQAAWRTSLGLWERGVAAEPESKLSWFFLANERAKVFDQAGSLRAWRRITEVDPGDETAWHYLALGEASQGNPAEGVRIMRESVARCPDSPVAWANLAVVLVEAGRPEEARQALADGLRRRPGDPLLLEKLEGLRTPDPR